MGEPELSDHKTPIILKRAPSQNRIEIPDPTNEEECAQWYVLLSRSSDELPLQEILRSLVRRRMILVATIVTITPGPILIVLQLGPKCAATALVLIGDRETQVLEVDDILSGPCAVEAKMERLAHQLMTLPEHNLSKVTQ